MDISKLTDDERDEVVRRIKLYKKYGVGKYKVEYNGVITYCYTISEIARLINKSEQCVFRLLDNKIKFASSASDSLRPIKIYKIEKRINFSEI